MSSDAGQPKASPLLRGDEGFTLIELMVVLLIMAILIAIAIPTFLGVSGAASDRAAQSNLSNALVEATSQFQSSNQNFSVDVPTTLNTSAPEFVWTTGDCVDAPTRCVSTQIVDVDSPGDSEGLILSVYSQATNTCWYALNLLANPSYVTPDASGTPFTAESGAATAGTYYSKQTVPSGGHCEASIAVQPTWKWGPTYASAGSN